MQRLSEEDVRETMEDFYGLCVTQKVINEGGIYGTPPTSTWSAEMIESNRRSRVFSTMLTISGEVRDVRETMEDFYGLCVTQKVINEGGVIYARDVLEKAFGPEQAASLMERLSR
mgnify:CR=1 FL=1